MGNFDSSDLEFLFQLGVPWKKFNLAEQVRDRHPRPRIQEHLDA
jgi:hypothetical protein